MQDRRLAQIVKRCSDMPGSALFQYLDEDGQPQSVDSGDVNEYLHEVSGAEFTAKDFRTWGGTCLAAEFLLPVALRSKATSILRRSWSKWSRRSPQSWATSLQPARSTTFIHRFCNATERANSPNSRKSTRRATAPRLYERMILALLTPLKRARAKAVAA